jgi:hypothetical protein
LVEARRDLVGERVCITNQLTANLKGYYFPQALACFEDIASTLACDFLRHWPSLGEAKRGREPTVRNLFHAHLRGEARIAASLALLRDALPLTTDAGVLRPALLATGILVEKLRVVLAGIARYERAIDKAFKAHPDAAIFASFAGPARCGAVSEATAPQRAVGPSHVLGLLRYKAVSSDFCTSDGTSIETNLAAEYR